MNARETAFQILLNFEKSGEQLDYLIEKNLNSETLSRKERKFVTNLVSGVVRHKALCDWKLASLFTGNYKKALSKFKIILRLALYEIDFLDYIPPHATANEYVNIAKKRLPKSNISTINALIRTYLREGKYLKPEKKFKYDETILAIRHSFPEWLIKRWLGIWGADFVTNMCRIFNDRPTFDIRVNENKVDVEDFKKILVNEKINFSESFYFPNVFKITDVQKIRQTNLLKNGYCTVQDESGIIVSHLLNPARPGDHILDACAAPGGKYTALYEKYSKDVNFYGLEINPKRLNLIKENCRRLGFSDQHLVNGDAINPPFKKIFDQILVDAPCSGFGTIQKHPDIKWRRTLEEIFSFQKLQLSILNNLSKHLKSGGYLIYSTCTIDPSENEMVISEFLKLQKGQFIIIPPPAELMVFTDKNNYVRTFPHQHDMEGSFAVKLQKTA
jgi:16S rRNA (cytosine967-C5)-methyltransferase